MALRDEEIKVGARVKIPIQKEGVPEANNFWGLLQHFNYQLPYMIIEAVEPDGYIKIGFATMRGLLPGANAFKPEDLELYPT